MLHWQCCCRSLGRSRLPGHQTLRLLQTEPCCCCCRCYAGCLRESHTCAPCALQELVLWQLELLPGLQGAQAGAPAKLGLRKDLHSSACLPRWRQSLALPCPGRQSRPLPLPCPHSRGRQRLCLLLLEQMILEQVQQKGLWQQLSCWTARQQLPQRRRLRQGVPFLQACRLVLMWQPAQCAAALLLLLGRLPVC